jgi:hypothetical protein
MTETQLQEGKNLQVDRALVFDQMKSMKEHINQCSRKNYATEDGKEDYDTFRLNLLNQCDAFVESQRAKIDLKFAAV